MRQLPSRQSVCEKYKQRSCGSLWTKMLLNLQQWPHYNAIYSKIWWSCTISSPAHSCTLESRHMYSSWIYSRRTKCSQVCRCPFSAEEIWEKGKYALAVAGETVFDYTKKWLDPEAFSMFVPKHGNSCLGLMSMKDSEDGLVSWYWYRR